ncbi:hypothetical protein LNKW23_44190 [Paralimibaculum aggregatum]|uniref:Ig-like domain-containing protein n=1 Tax=Paralimibaculum aggregatum TaxID=3036245 RepID=A0ABQ6LT02_9RHOB|nr:SRPBCC family protein [Limibaculum sp. NKW23]GMG85203.1 hypothetical protein LNKW23_44190 [Limibaculum sp. NKW23]
MPARAGEASGEITIAADPKAVGSHIGPSCAISGWYPGIAGGKHEEISGATHRRLVTADGAVFLETLLEHDDEAMRYSCTIEEGPLPVTDDSATRRVEPSGGKARASRSGNFAAKGTAGEAAISLMSGVHDAGPAAIRETVPHQRTLASPSGQQHLPPGLRRWRGGAPRRPRPGCACRLSIRGRRSCARAGATLRQGSAIAEVRGPRLLCGDALGRRPWPACGEGCRLPDRRHDPEARGPC